MSVADTLDDVRRRFEDDDDSRADEDLLRELFDAINAERSARSFVLVVTSHGDWRGESFVRGPFATEDEAHRWAKSSGLEDATDADREDGDLEYLVRVVIGR